MTSDPLTQNEINISDSMYLSNNYVNIKPNIRSPCQQYHPPNEFDNEQYNEKNQNFENENFLPSDEFNKERRLTNVTHYANNIPHQVNNTANAHTDEYVSEWGAPTSTDAIKDSNGSSDVSNDKQSSPESNGTPGCSTTSSSSSTIQTSNITINEAACSSSTGNSSSNNSSPLQNVIPMCIYILSRVAIYLEIENTANATVVDIMSMIMNSEELNINKTLAENLFTLWMCSPFLELQLKVTHKPVQIRRSWRYLLDKYSHCTQHQQNRDEPRLMLKRNIFCTRQYEEKIKDPKILELLYVEAKYNILEGRYPCEIHHCVTLGGIQARIELGQYNPQVHTINFFREQQWKFLPNHIRKSTNWIWLPISSKSSAEVRLLEQYKRIPQSATNKKLIRKYLEFCWSLPFYGSAFFHGQIEQPVRSLTSFLIHQDISILVAVNEDGVYVIDNVQGTLLLGLKYEELSWEYARPSREDNKNCLPCLFLQFMVVENGTQVSKILQIFSRQAQMMDALITSFVDRFKKKIAQCNEQCLNNAHNSNNGLRTPLHTTRRDMQQGVLSNKLNKLVLCTFDEDGRCIGKMGSWSFSY